MCDPVAELDELMNSLEEGDMLMIFYEDMLFQVPILAVGEYYNYKRCYRIGSFDLTGDGAPNWKPDPHTWEWDDTSHNLVTRCKRDAVPEEAELSVEHGAALTYVAMYEKKLTEQCGASVSH